MVHLLREKKNRFGKIGHALQKGAFLVLDWVVLTLLHRINQERLLSRAGSSNLSTAGIWNQIILWDDGLAYAELGV